MWSWLTLQRGARLITGPIGELPPITTIDEHGGLVMPRASETIAVSESPPA
jgi:hypothetical protein